MSKVTLFGQIIQRLDRSIFNTLVRQHKTDKYQKGFNSWSHLVSMLFSQFAKSQSLRDISNGLRSATGNLNHLGNVQYPSKSNLGYTGSTGWINCVTACGKTINGCYYTRSFTYSVTIDKNNDGLLSTHHQEIPGLDDDDIYIARGVNHLEMLDARGSSFKRPNIDDEMQETYDDIFARRHLLDFFRLTP